MSASLLLPSAPAPSVPGRRDGKGNPRRQKRRSAIQRRNRLVELHHDLVRPLAVHYCRCSPEPLDDLIQVGLLGLIRAAELFERSQGTPFPAFARPHIRGAILHHLRDSAPAVRLPRRQAEQQEHLQRLQRELGDRARPAQWNERLARIGLDHSQACLLLRQRKLNRPLALLPEHEEGVAPAGEWAQDGQIIRGYDPGAFPVEALLSALQERERFVVEQVVLAGQSYRQLAGQLKISPMTVRRMLHRSLDRLRQLMEQRGDQRGLNQPLRGYRGRSAAPAC
ncbi:MAG: sigma-70 family RNA polymerase sigma factor [Cyanobium sp.]